MILKGSSISWKALNNLKKDYVSVECSPTNISLNILRLISQAVNCLIFVLHLIETRNYLRGREKLQNKHEIVYNKFCLTLLFFGSMISLNDRHGNSYYAYHGNFSLHNLARENS